MNHSTESPSASTSTTSSTHAAYNRLHYERFVVVTDTHDERTQALCRRFHVDCLITDVFYERARRSTIGPVSNWTGSSRTILDGSMCSTATF